MKAQMEDPNLSTADSTRLTYSSDTVNWRWKGRWLKGSLWLGLAVSLILGSVTWLSLTATKLSTELSAASDLVPTLKYDVLQKDASAAAVTVRKMTEHTAAARAAGTDPLWTAAQAIPWLGANFQAASEVATSADDVATLGAGPLVSILEPLEWKTLAPMGTGINLGPLEAATPALVAASYAVQQSSDRLNVIDANSLFPQISVPLIKAREQLTSLRTGLRSAADAASIAPAMLGSEKPRHYLLLVQNNAEARATGGIPGALAVLTADKGKISLSSQSSAHDLGTFNPPVVVDAEQQHIYSTRLGKYMQDVTLTPDFPTAATTALAMWEQRSGERLDGAISIDPVALGYVLDATGPVSIQDPQLQALTGGKLPNQLSGNNIVKTLLSDVYAQFNNAQLQDAYFAGVAREVFGALSSGKADANGLLTGVGKGVEDRRILLWSADSGEQSVLNQYPLSGSISGASVSPAQFGVYFNDGTGAKMDYYVKRTVQLVKECAKDGYEGTTVRVTSTNTAPADAATSLPSYVTGGGAFGVPPGSVQTNIVTYGPVQSNVETAKLDGQRTDFAAHLHSNRPVGVLTVKLAPGESKTVEFTFGKIVQPTEPNLVVTPTVEDVKDVILPTENAACG